MERIRFGRGLYWAVVFPFLLVPTKAQASGLRAVGEAFDTAADPAWWTLNGSASWDATSRRILLTNAADNQAGSIFWKWTMLNGSFEASFDFWIGGGSGGEGLTFAWVKGPLLLGEGGASLGFDGLDGYAIRFDTRSDSEGEPENYIAVSSSTPEGRKDLFIYSLIPEMEGVLDSAGNPAPFHVRIAAAGGACLLWMSNPTAATPMPETQLFEFEAPDYSFSDAYFGFTAATGSVNNVHAIDNMVVREWRFDHETWTVYPGDLVTLDPGSEWQDAIGFLWTQIAGEPIVALDNPNPRLGISHFVAPNVTVPTHFRFEVTIELPSGWDTDVDGATVLPRSRPVKPPSNLQALPIHLGCLLSWEGTIDAKSYVVEMELIPGEWFPIWNTAGVWAELKNLTEGMDYTVRVIARNDYGDSDPSEPITFIPLRNLALPAVHGGTSPPSQYVYVFSSEDIASVNDADSYPGTDSKDDSLDAKPKMEDFWGYLWDEHHYFKCIVYWPGRLTSEGGWFTSLSVQCTQDGVTWRDIPGAKITPPYDFTDSLTGRKNFSRYDITFGTVRGKGIRIYGKPGGSATYTSVGELEIYGGEPGIIPIEPFEMFFPERSTVHLDGTFLFSVRGPILTYHWEQISGPAVELENADKAIAWFIAPGVDEDMLLLFRVTGWDGVEELSREYYVTVRNLVTTAVAGPDQRVLAGAGMILNGSGSVTTTGTLTYLWTQTGGTDVGITGSTSPVVSFAAPEMWDFTEELLFRLDVDDGAGAKRSDEVKVTLFNFGGMIYALGPGYFRDMLHLGAGAVDRITDPLHIGTDHLKNFGGEAQVNPRPGGAYDFTGTGVTATTNPMVWTPLPEDNGWFMWDGRAGEALDDFIQYYHLYIISPEERDVQWHFRHDDEMRIWNNGAPAIVRDGWDGGVEIVRFGVGAIGAGLKKGVNSLTLKLHEWGGANYLALRVTDLDGNEFTDLQYSLGLPVGLPDAYATRSLPDSYQAGGTVEVSLSLFINPANLPASVTVREEIPAGIPQANVTAIGAIVEDGAILWNLTGADVKTSTITYSLVVPEGTTRGLRFAGTVSLDTTSSDILGQNIVYAVPTEPRNVTVEMLMAAHLTWSPPPEEGVVAYKVFRSVNGGAWEQIGATTETSYVDNLVVPGNLYSYSVSGVSASGVGGASSSPSPQASLPPPGTFQIREAEDYNYDGGKFPWTSAVTLCAIEAPSENEIGTPVQYDYWTPGTLDPSVPRIRPCEDIGIRTAPDYDWPDVLVSCISWLEPGAWFRYGFNVTQAGWVKLTFRVSSPEGGTLAAYWDEELVGTASFKTGHWDRFTWVALEQFEETQTGVHHLRVALLSGQMDFDKTAIGFNWTSPKRETIWSDNFDGYETDADVKATGWAIENGSGYLDAAWRLWDTEGPPLGNQDPNLAGMYDKYMISDSDLAPDADLDERLITRQISCADYIKVRLNFSKNYGIYEDPEHLQVAEVDIQVFDNGVWGEWVTLLHWDRSSGDSATPEQVDISSFADKKTIRLRWHFYDAKWDYWFAIDDVRVSGERVEQPPLPPCHGFRVCWPPIGNGEYTVQQSDDLVSWVNAPGTWPITSGCWCSGDISGVRKRFYRVMSQ